MYNYESYKVEELRNICRNLKIKGYSKMKKADLINAVKNVAAEKPYLMTFAELPHFDLKESMTRINNGEELTIEVDRTGSIPHDMMEDMVSDMQTVMDLTHTRGFTHRTPENWKQMNRKQKNRWMYLDRKRQKNPKFNFNKEMEKEL